MRITTSDLARCVETARILTKTLNVAISADKRLREVSFGEAEGRPIEWLASGKEAGGFLPIKSARAPSYRKHPMNN
ncbi:histidine phosphatase family protein [Nocardia salmonicida]|uniref:histidine phosphatase family protein n=1 Tax=Nocardia salmonicida TaxID=53431 RepID=UPI003648DE6E